MRTVLLALVALAFAGAAHAAPPTSGAASSDVAAMTYAWKVREIENGRATAWASADKFDMKLFYLAARYSEQRPGEGTTPAHWGAMMTYELSCADRTALEISVRYFDLAGKSLGVFVASGKSSPFASLNLMAPIMAEACGAPVASPSAQRTTATWQGAQTWLAGMLPKSTSAPAASSGPLAPKPTPLPAPAPTPRPKDSANLFSLDAFDWQFEPRRETRRAPGLSHAAIAGSCWAA